MGSPAARGRRWEAPSPLELAAAAATAQHCRPLLHPPLLHLRRCSLERETQPEQGQRRDALGRLPWPPTRPASSAAPSSPSLSPPSSLLGNPEPGGCQPPLLRLRHSPAPPARHHRSSPLRLFIFLSIAPTAVASALSSSPGSRAAAPAGDLPLPLPRPLLLLFYTPADLQHVTPHLICHFLFPLVFLVTVLPCCRPTLFLCRAAETSQKPRPPAASEVTPDLPRPPRSANRPAQLLSPWLGHTLDHFCFASVAIYCPASLSPSLSLLLLNRDGEEQELWQRWRTTTSCTRTWRGRPPNGTTSRGDWETSSRSRSRSSLPLSPPVPSTTPGPLRLRLGSMSRPRRSSKTIAASTTTSSSRSTGRRGWWN